MALNPRPRFAQFQGVGTGGLARPGPAATGGGAMGAAATALAGLGAIAGGLAEVVAGEEKAQTAAYLADTALDIRETAARLALDHENDPDAFDATWTSYGEGLIASAPEPLRERVAREVRAKGFDAWRRLEAAHRGRLNEQARMSRFGGLEALGRDYAAAMREGRVQVAANADGVDIPGGDAGLHARDYAAMLDAMVAAGDLTGQQAAARLDALERDGRQQLVLGEFDRVRARGLDAAEDFIARFDGADDVADPVERAALTRHMRGQLADLKAERRQALGELRGRAAVAVAAVTAGRTFAGMAKLEADAARLGDGDTLAALAGARELARGLDAFARLPLDEQRAEIARRAGAVAGDLDNRRLDAMGRIHARTAQALAKAPIAFAEEVGVRDFGALDFADPGTFARRVADGQWLAERYGLPQVPILKAAEAEGLKARLAAATPAEKTLMLGSMAAGLGGHLPAVLAAVAADDPEFAHAGVLAGTDPAAAQAILEGQEIKRIAPKFVPTRDATYRDKVQEALPNAVLRGMGPGFAAGLEETVLAVYAGLSREADDGSKAVDADRLKTAVAVVTGGLVRRDRPALGTGDFVTVAPVRGMTDDAFEALVAGLTDADLGPAFLPYPGKSGGGRVSARDLRQIADLVWLGDGRYAMEIGGTPVVRGDGSPAVLDLGAIARGEARDEEMGAAP